ncbi:MAG: glycosyltransferase family 4 protein [Solirubrobacteraceae bacterium]|nr:glycosyltransferase family 4 protein [Solirubrobacteraceae bacterium]
MTSHLSLVSRVLAKLEPGGAQLSVLRVIRALEGHGIASRLLVGWASPKGLALAGRMGVEVEVYGEGGDLQWEPDIGFSDWLESRLSGADVIHAHMFGAWWAAAQAAPPGVPLVASEHNALTWPHGRPALALRPALERVDLFYGHGPGARTAILAAGLAPDKMRPGISPLGDLGAQADPKLPVPRIVYAGRLHHEKGADVLVEALARLPLAPQAFLLGDGPMREQLQRRIDVLGMGERVHLRGWQNRPGSTMAGATVVVVPSRDEAWSQTAVQAMALGATVIGTDVDGLPDTLAQRRGIVVVPDNPDVLADAIDGVLTGRRHTDLAAARRYALQFTPARVSAEYAKAYRALHGASNPHAPVAQAS